MDPALHVILLPIYTVGLLGILYILGKVSMEFQPKCKCGERMFEWEEPPIGEYSTRWNSCATFKDAWTRNDFLGTVDHTTTNKLRGRLT